MDNPANPLSRTRRLAAAGSFGLAVVVLTTTAFGTVVLRRERDDEPTVGPNSNTKSMPRFAPLPTTDVPMVAPEPVDVTETRTEPVAITAVGVGDCSALPTWFPADIGWRESNCRYDAVSPDGVYVGAFQIATFHWDAGACADLDWNVPAQQDECAWRLSRNGTDFGPWGA